MVWRKQQQAEVDETKTVACVAVLVVNTHTHMYRAVLLIEECCRSANNDGERDKVEQLHSGHRRAAAAYPSTLAVVQRS